MIMTDPSAVCIFSAVFNGSQDSTEGQGANKEDAPKGITTKTPRSSQKTMFSPLS